MLKKFSLVLCAIVATIFSGGWLFSSDYLGVTPKEFTTRYNAALEGVKAMVGASSLDHLKITGGYLKDDIYYYNLKSASAGTAISGMMKGEKFQQVVTVSANSNEFVSATIAACYACPEIAKISNLTQKLASFLDNVHKRGSDEYNEGKIKLMGVRNNGVFIFKAVYVD